jgi:hypothetical protein
MKENRKRRKQRKYQKQRNIFRNFAAYLHNQTACVILPTSSRTLAMSGQPTSLNK